MKCGDCLLTKRYSDDPHEVIFCTVKQEYIDPDDYTCDEGEFDD